MERGPEGKDWQEEGQDPLRDWQKNTWYGPYPINENPFDEPEDAPELKDLRSDELNNRSGEFWEKQTGGYQFGQTPAVSPEAPQVRPKRKKRTGGTKGIILIVLAVLLGVGILLNYIVFTVKTITVEGTRTLEDSEVIRLSGLRTGTPMMQLDEAAAKRGIEQNPALKFRYLKKDYPDRVTLAVRERQACCWMTWNGILYTMDKQRWVLYESEILPSSMQTRKKSGSESADAAGSEGTESGGSGVVSLAAEYAAGIGNVNGETGEQSGETGETAGSGSQREALEKANRIESELVRVDGLNIRSGSMLGQRLSLENQEQQEAFTALFLEMTVLGCTEMIQQADLSSLNSLLLTTRDGFTVSMGNSQNIHAKLRSMLITREELLRRGYRGGVINVTLPETPIYSPPSN